MCFEDASFIHYSDKEFLDWITEYLREKRYLGQQELFYLGQFCNNKVSSSMLREEVINWLISALKIYELIYDLNKKCGNYDIKRDEMNMNSGDTILNYP